MVFSSDKIYEQVIYTVGRDLQYQNTVVADTAPLVTAPVVVCTSTSEIFRTSVHLHLRLAGIMALFMDQPSLKTRE